MKWGLSSIGDGDGGAGGSEVGEGLFGTMRRTTTSLDLGAVAKAAVGEVEGGFETGNEEHKDDDEDVFGSVRAGPIAGAEANSFVEPKEEAVKGCTAVENAAREEAVVGEESSCSSSFSVSASASSPAEAAVAVVDVVTPDKNESLVKTRPVILEKPSAVEVKKTTCKSLPPEFATSTDANLDFVDLTAPALPATPAKVPGLSNFTAKALIKSPSPVEPAKTGPSSSFRTPKEIPVANDGSWIPVRKRMGKALRKPVADSLSPVPPGPPHRESSDPFALSSAD